MPYIKKQLIHLFDNFWDNKFVKTDLFLQIYETNPIILLTDGFIKIPFIYKNFDKDLKGKNDRKKSNSFLVNSIVIVHDCKLKIKVVSKDSYYFILTAEKIDLLCPGMFLSNWGKPKYIRSTIKPYKRNIIHKLILMKIKNYKKNSIIDPEIIYDINEEDKFKFNNLVIFKRIDSDNEFFKKMREYASLVFEVDFVNNHIKEALDRRKKYPKVLRQKFEKNNIFNFDIKIDIIDEEYVCVTEDKIDPETINSILANNKNNLKEDSKKKKKVGRPKKNSKLPKKKNKKKKKEKRFFYN